MVIVDSQVSKILIVAYSAATTSKLFGHAQIRVLGKCSDITTRANESQRKFDLFRHIASHEYSFWKEHRAASNRVSAKKGLLTRDAILFHWLSHHEIPRGPFRVDI